MNKHIRTWIVTALLVIVTPTYAVGEDFSLIVDKYYSPFMGADLMVSGLRGYQAIDDVVASGTMCNTSGWMTTIRLGKTVFELTLSNFAVVLQHEIFGHGARGREFNLSDIGYHINFFSGATTYSVPSFNALDNNQKAAFTSGGVEATSLLAQKIERGWLKDGAVDSRAAAMYLVSTLDEMVYAFSTTSVAFHPDNDANHYINYVNNWYGQQALTSHQLKVSMAWNWLNPMFYISGYSLIKYVLEGDNALSFSTLHISDMRFMPTTHTLFAPYGPEYQLQLNLFTPQDKYIGVFLRYGKTEGKNSYGADLLVNPMQDYDCWTLVNKLSVWHQPHLLQNNTASTNTSKYGFGEFLTVYYRVSKGVSALGELGYKTSGYLPGTQLSGGVIWRVGFAFDLDPKGKC